MSAWAQIVNADGSDEWLELCNAALLEVQAEQRRKSAALIRSRVKYWEGMSDYDKVASVIKATTADLVEKNG